MAVKGKLAYCIPTYQRPNLIARFLERYGAIYLSLGIDIYIYDSSKDNSTREFVSRFQASGIYYIKIPSQIHANEKLLLIYQREGWVRDYEFVWAAGDRLFCEASAVEKILKILNPCYDLILADGWDYGSIGDREYREPNKLFRDCAWYMTLFGSVILNTDTMLSHIPWDRIRETYVKPDRIYYSHVGLYFETIQLLDSFQAFHLSLPETEFHDYVNTKSGWDEEVFYVLCHCWPEVIRALPDVYQNKKCVIKSLGCNSVFMLPNLERLRKNKIYNFKIFASHFFQWKKVTDVPLWRLCALAMVRPQYSVLVEENGVQKLVRHKALCCKLKGFCRRYESVYIYGAGRCAVRYASYLEQWNITYDGFVVTESEGNPKELMGHPVITLTQLKNLEVLPGIVAGLNREHLGSIQSILTEAGLAEHTFCQYIPPI